MKPGIHPTYHPVHGSRLAGSLLQQSVHTGRPSSSRELTLR
jgi:hypothetical protein